MCIIFPQVMAQQAKFGRKYLKAFVSGFFVAVPVTVTVLDRLAYVARVDGASMQVGGLITVLMHVSMYALHLTYSLLF